MSKCVLFYRLVDVGTPKLIRRYWSLAAVNHCCCPSHLHVSAPYSLKFALHSAIHRTLTAPHQPSDLDRYTSKVTKRFVDHLSLSLTHRFEELQSEDDQGSDVYSDVDPPNWQQLVGRDVLAGLTPHEIKRQEVINGSTLFHISHRCTWDV